MKELIDFIEVASTNIGQATFYNRKSSQIAQLMELHIKLLIKARRYYSLVGLLPINDYSKTKILGGLLGTGNQRLKVDEQLEWLLIKAIADELPLTRLLRFFVEDIAHNNAETGTKRLNNARVRRLGQRIWDKANAYQVIKYQHKYKTIIRHCRIKPGSSRGEEKLELQNWLFGKLKKPEEVKQCQLLRDRLLAAKGNKKALVKLPLDVAEGIAFHQLKMSKKDFAALYSQQGRGSKQEVMRSRSASGKENVAIDFSNYGLLELIRYAQNNQEEWGEIYPHINNAAKSLAVNLTLPAQVALVVDNSLSMTGKKERKNYPIAFAEAITRLCLATDSETHLWFSHEINPHQGPFKVGGATDLRLPLAMAITTTPDAVIIISDGYENQSSGSVAAILNTSAVQKSGISFFHLNPVAASEGETATRTLAEGMELMAVGDIKQFPMAALMAQFKQNSELLTAHLDRVYEALLLGDVRKAKAIASLSSGTTTIQ